MNAFLLKANDTLQYVKLTQKTGVVSHLDWPWIYLNTSYIDQKYNTLF